MAELTTAGVAEPAPDPIVDSTREMSSPLRVLLVEDMALIRDAVSELIEGSGHARVTFATDSESSAVQALCEQRFDVVIVDLQLREGSGFGVLRAMRALPCFPRVIVLTNYAAPLARARCFELGADCVLDKSREFDRLPALLQAWRPAPAALHA